MLVDIIINGYKISAPPELLEHYYKKEYGISTQEFMNEPADRISWFVKIKEIEALRDQRELKKAKQKR